MKNFDRISFRKSLWIPTSLGSRGFPLRWKSLWKSWIPTSLEPSSEPKSELLEREREISDLVCVKMRTWNALYSIPKGAFRSEPNQRLHPLACQLVRTLWPANWFATFGLPTGSHPLVVQLVRDRWRIGSDPDSGAGSPTGSQPVGGSGPVWFGSGSGSDHTLRPNSKRTRPGREPELTQTQTQTQIQTRARARARHRRRPAAAAAASGGARAHIRA